MDNSESDELLDPWRDADRRRLPAHLKRKRRKRPAPKPAVTEKVINESKQPLAACARCGQVLAPAASTGRPRIYCSPACRKAAYEDRRAHRDGAVQIKLVDRIVAQTIERVERRPHTRKECVTTVMADPAAMREVLRRLSVQVGAGTITPEDKVFWDLVTSTDFLREALARAANRADRSER